MSNPHVCLTPKPRTPVKKIYQLTGSCSASRAMRQLKCLNPKSLSEENSPADFRKVSCLVSICPALLTNSRDFQTRTSGIRGNVRSTVCSRPELLVPPPLYCQQLFLVFFVADRRASLVYTCNIVTRNPTRNPQFLEQKNTSEVQEALG